MPPIVWAIFLLTPTLRAQPATYSAGRPVLAQTPPMGWNSWNAFRLTITDALGEKVAELKAQPESLKHAGLYRVVWNLNYAGGFLFKAVSPGTYVATLRIGEKTWRPAHIHFQVTGRQDRLVTQMYFENDPYNAVDPFLNSAARKELLVTKLLAPSPEFEPDSKMVIFDIVLYKG